MSTRQLRGDNVPVEPEPINDSDWVPIYTVEIPVMIYKQMRVRMTGFRLGTHEELVPVNVIGESFVRMYVEAR